MLPSYPQFSNLKLSDKEIYNELIAEHTPYSDILFSTLHIWWNLGGNLAVSILNGNLVIYYHLTFDEDNSGYGLVGINDIDSSTQTIFNHLTQQGKRPMLIHTPEFVVKEITNKSRLRIEEEADYSEYILEVEPLATLEGHEAYDLRKKINRFKRETEGQSLEIKYLDLSSKETQDELQNKLNEWENNRPPKNDRTKTEHLAMKKSLEYSQELDLQSLALYIDGELFGFAIYDQPLKKEYFVIHHLRVNYDVLYVSDYIHHKLAELAKSLGVVFLNIEMDLGIDSLKKHKLSLKPVNFLRKYRIEPIST